MATNFPDTSINNPATGRLWADGDSYPDPESGLIYYWYSPVWKTEVHPTATTDEKYVEVTGDNMTDNLTLGPDGGPAVIELDASGGKASFESDVTVGGDVTVGTDKIVLDSSVGTASFYEGAVAISSGVMTADPSIRIISNNNSSSQAITVDNGASPQVSINMDGSSDFKGDMQISKGTNGFNLDADSGTFVITNKNTDGAQADAFRIYTGNNADGEWIYPVTFRTDGSATFASTIKSNKSVEIYRPNSESGFGALYVGTANNGAETVNGGWLGDGNLCIGHPGNVNSPVVIKPDGNATFDGLVLSNEAVRAHGQAYEGVARGASLGNGYVDVANLASEYPIRVYTVGTADPTAKIQGNGSATFKGDIICGNNPSDTVTTNGARLVPAGHFYVRNNANVNAIQIYQNNVSDATISLTTNGSARFAGKISPGSISFGLPADLTTNGGTTGYDDSTKTYQLHSGSSLNTNAKFGFYFNKNTTPTITFQQNGNIEGGNVVFNLDPDNDANYTTTTEEYTDTEYYTVEVPVVERPGTGTADIQDGVSTADLVDGDERQTQTITKSREVTKTREVKTYTGPTLNVKEELQSLRARATQQDEVIAMMTKALKDLGADVSAFPAPEVATAKTKTTKKK